MDFNEWPVKLQGSDGCDLEWHGIGACFSLRVGVCVCVEFVCCSRAPHTEEIWGITWVRKRFGLAVGSSGSKTQLESE